jgi:hypothetical protein
LPGILTKEFVELITRFTEVLNRLWEIRCVLWKDPRKHIATRLAEIICFEFRIFFSTGGDNSIKKMSTHKFVIGEAVKYVAFHSIVGIQRDIGQVNFAPAPYIDTQT